MSTENKFKFSTLRQFGSENISFTSEITSENSILSKEEIQAQVKMFSTMLNEAFVAVQEREISEKALLAGASTRRREEVAKLDKALQDEILTKAKAEKTAKFAEKISKEFTKK